MSTSGQDLIGRLGGPPVIAAIVQDMYTRVLADPELEPFFANTPLDRLRHMQYEFIVSALDGPIKYSGGDLTLVHRGRGITAKHFAKFCGHLADAMDAAGIDATDVDQTLARLAMYKDKVTGEAEFSG